MAEQKGQRDQAEAKDEEDREQPPRKRSRNSSANSGMSYDSAIGDIYFVGTPHSALDLERELLELTSGLSKYVDLTHLSSLHNCCLF